MKSKRQNVTDFITGWTAGCWVAGFLGLGPWTVDPSTVLEFLVTHYL